MEAKSVQLEMQTAVRTDLGAIFVSLELSRSTWLITSLSPGNGEKMSKHVVDRAGSGNLHSGDKWNFCLTSA
jgi:transposase